MKITTANVWAKPLTIGKNTVRQLLVRETSDIVLRDEDEQLSISSRYGTWPATRGGSATEDGALSALLPIVARSSFRVTWVGSREMESPEQILDTYRGAIQFYSPGDTDGLRRPQAAALHSIIGYQSSGLRDPAIVVMPTGTGKTETMLAWMIAARPEKLLVIVPSAALREQLASKFESLGILQREKIVVASASCPRVGRLEHRLDTVDEALEFVRQSNVVVATPNAVQACAAEVREALLESFTHLVVDEAHHAPAVTWAAIVRVFPGQNVLLFTATPFRSDEQSLPGRIIFRFPLREAQKEGYFSQIDFTAILAVGDPDFELASAAIGRLRKDLKEGFDHVLLARAKTKTRANDILAIYKELAGDLYPVVIYEDLGPRKRAGALKALRGKLSRIVVCVDMLGEGFDEPSLKVAAFHDSRRSLSPMIQLIGRLARTSSPTPIGTASIFVNQSPSTIFSPLRSLLREDPDWNLILSDITERATARANDVSDFDSAFEETPSAVPVGLLEPKMSAVAFHTTSDTWNPQAVADLFGPGLLDRLVSVNAANNVAWLVLETTEALRWGRIPGLHTATYELIVFYFDRERGLLFVYGSNTKREYDQLVAKLLHNSSSRLINGIQTFRVFSRLDRITPTNVGLLDARDRDKRFSMHVGSNVEAALTEAEKNHKANTHVSARAYDNGERISISAALSGRFWSMQTAPSLLHWKEWCDRQGDKLLDTSVDLRSLFRNMIIPEDVTSRPPYPVLGMEWPWELYLGSGTNKHSIYGGKSHVMTDVDLRVDAFSDHGDLYFSCVTSNWEVPYIGKFGDHGVRYFAVGLEISVDDNRGAQVNLSEWLNRNKPTLFLSGDRMITGDDRLLVPRTELTPYDRSLLKILPWAGVDIRVESQGSSRRQDSIQAYMVRHLKATTNFDVLIDDDRAGEAADLVGLRVDGDTLIVTLVHCKYSSQDSPGGRVGDMYEVCGQAIRGARWRDQNGFPLLAHLDRRAQNYSQRTGQPAYEIGDRAALFRIQEKAPQLFLRFETVIAQPGLSAKLSTNEQLRLIAGAQSYVQAVTKGSFTVYCSI